MFLDGHIEAWNGIFNFAHYGVS
jgi:CRAL/TRIO domain